MSTIIESLVLFLEENKVDPIFEDAHKKYGHARLRLFCYELLKWLRSELFVPRKKSIKYHNQPQWFADFSLFVRNTEGLSELFSCGDYSIDFREEVAFDRRIEIHEYVVANYKPHLFVTHQH
jgi:hypothetical protein